MRNKKEQRQKRIRKKIDVVTERPRLSVFRSNKYIYAQIIDKSGDTILGLSEKSVVGKGSEKISPIDRAVKLGSELAKKAIAKKIKDVVFDKGRFAYHGKVAAVAKGARDGGLNF